MLNKFYTAQPAQIIYPFAGGWQVISYVFQNIFSRTEATAKFWFLKGDTWKVKAEYETNNLLKYWYWSAFAGFWLAGVVQYISAMFIVTLFACIQFLILVIWAGFTLLVMAILAFSNFVYSNYYKIYNRCPDCHEQMDVPIFVCPTCATEHSRLWPSIYGVFHHRCKCGDQLPTLNSLGRKKLIQKCAACRTPMNSEIGSMINIHIPVIGGPSTGKSNYIAMATAQLIKDYGKSRGYLFDFPDSNHKLNFESNVHRLSTGSPLVKTTEIIPQAYNLSIKKTINSIGRIVYIYDAAGEAYSDETNTAQQIYYKFIHGLIFIVDPFSIDNFVNQHQAEIDALRTSIRPSDLDVQKTFERMKTVLEGTVGFKKGKRFTQPIAVVISKTDALNLETLIGRSAARKLMSRNPSIRLETDAMHFLLEKFLIENQLGNFVRNLYTSFEKVTFYSCSSLGRLPNNANQSAFAPIGVLEPLTWLLGEMSILPSKNERKEFIDQEHKMMSNAQGNVIQKFINYYWDSLKLM